MRHKSVGSTIANSKIIKGPHRPEWPNKLGKSSNFERWVFKKIGDYRLPYLTVSELELIDFWRTDVHDVYSSTLLMSLTSNEITEYVTMLHIW